MDMTRRTTAPAALLLAVLTSACNTDVTPPAQSTFAYGELQAIENPTTGAVTTRPFIALFRASNVSFPDSRAAGDQCATLTVPVNPPDPNIPTAFNYIEGGTDVTLTLAGVPRALPKTQQIRTDGTVLYYGRPSEAGGFSPNADMTFSVPGASGGFPAATITGHTTVPFTLQTIPDANATTQTLPLRWSAPPSGHGSAMLVELRYAGLVSGTPTPLAIYCSLIDDGSFDVPSSLAAGWYEADANSHHAIFQRLLTRAEQFNGYGAVVSSTYTVTKQTPPPTVVD